MNALHLTEIGLCFSMLCWAQEVEVVEAALQKELFNWQGRLVVPGITAAFVLPDGQFGEVAVGVADLETGEHMTHQHRMLAASIGKSFVGATALLLESEGRLNLDEPIKKWLGSEPWFSRLPGGDRITARHLLTHTSGLPDHVHLPVFQESVAEHWHEQANPFPPEALIGYVLDQPLLFSPGEGWSYSDTGFVLLGILLENVTGESVVDVIEERFLIPLHLTHTEPSDHRDLQGLAPGYTAKENPFGFPVKSTDGESRMRWHPGVENLGGGLISTSGDLARWGDALFAGAALPKSARVELRKTVATSAEPGSMRVGAGVGFLPQTPLGPVWGHGGWIPGYLSSLRHYSEHKITIAFQMNSDDLKSSVSPDWMREMELRLAEVVIQALEEGDHAERH